MTMRNDSNVSWEMLYERTILNLKLGWYTTARYNIDCLLRSLDNVECEVSDDK